MTRAWEFWIDVGGTFTDCLGRSPEGRMQRHKLLSSGVTKGTAAAGSRADRVVDPRRAGDPADCWTGYAIRFTNAQGQVIAESRVSRFERATGVLFIDPPPTVAVAPGQAYELSSGEEAPIVAIRHLLGLPLDQPLPPVTVRLGTTRGTNALLTRTGATTALVTTRGFGDILRIGYQNRPKLFELAIQKPAPLFAAVLEIDERVSANGEVLLAAEPTQIAAGLESLKKQGIESLAVCLLNAYAQPRHEQLVGAVARQLGFAEISLSHAVAPLIKIVSRGDTTVVDAYLNPVLRDYVQGLRRTLGSGRLQILTSAGGLVEAEHFVGKDSILSGPAGGVVGFSRAAQAAGFERAIGFDMGGTSTDVSRFDGEYELEYETEKAGVRIVAPMMSIETVAAGGGSLCQFDGIKLVVGPDSAGADPGPACYGRGGPLALTDVNLFLGKIPADHFPFALDRPAVEARLTDLREAIQRRAGRAYALPELADGFVRVANANMVRAIRAISMARGYDPRDYVLVAFGGAAGQHACAVARELGMRQVLSHPDAGILSACGVGQADIARHRAAGVYRAFSAALLRELEPRFTQLTAEAVAEIRAEGIAEDRISVRRMLDMRYQGQEHALTITQSDSHTFPQTFAAEHERLYGYIHRDRPLEIVALRVAVTGQAEPVAETPMPPTAEPVRPERTITAWFDAQPCATAVFERDRLRPGQKIIGPAILCEPRATTVIDPGWEGEVLARGELLLTDRMGARPLEVSTAADPIQLEIFNNQFAAIAEQMGLTLRRTASSVNVKERLDFSCALFTARGDLVVNAPHIPVHLGAMSETVKSLIADNPALCPGDVFVTNDPYRGGSHLPDITVVTPVHDARSGQLLFFTASRAHHAELGGVRPGSMPPFSRNLAEEGVLIRNFKIVAAGQSHLDALRELLLSGTHPTRAVKDNLADLTAQIAANRQGARDLDRLMTHYGAPVVTAYMDHIQQAAEQKMRQALTRLPDGEYPFADHLDDGSSLRVKITIAAAEAIIDFTGTGGVHAGNLNANRAIVTAAVMYCLRCLINEDIPLNQGVLAPIRLVLPEGLLNPPAGPDPEHCPAVVGGNVETSQRVVDVLLGALQLAAASQGTMNNVLFGDGSFGYYETICGGAGATPDADGASAVHTHMTNTRLTDPEVIEQRYPVRVRQFAIRRGSGGAGRWRGGDGVIRQLEFLRPLEVSILSQRRGKYPPFGLAGGHPGAPGRNLWRKKNGENVELGAAAQLNVQAGDILEIHTPGGGGYGAPE